MAKRKGTKGQEKIEDTKGVIRSRKSKKDRQYNGQTKWTSNDLQNTTQKTKHWATRTPLKTGGELKCSGGVSRDTRSVHATI